ncbi:MAG: helix-turn-helix transcriptional regulator [Candidatus Pseudobacter hemicellulosilyticus]|uniref:Helix-turn-helix transcriptional regulator n=1 Tax=Candidatus Pseudobacter hemicellulosilyticus TaxID=3121375 RepID=A0AAJ6BHR9_9BACT|nr:MAG: helix-turn-helix transcriptional regulator [Pseudobacter sp.]
MPKIGNNIKKIRTAKGLTQQAFADLFELTRGNISSYEENRAEPKIETLVRIANHFCIPLDKFITHNLTINEILRYNGDKLMEEEHQLMSRKLREVTFISDNHYLKCSRGELSFTEWSAFPKLVLPETSNNQLLALDFNNTIPHHRSLPTYLPDDVLVFEEVTQQNVHLCHEQTGLYTAANELMIGQYSIQGTQVELVLNDFRKHKCSFRKPMEFWRLFAVYGHQAS